MSSNTAHNPMRAAPIPLHRVHHLYPPIHGRKFNFNRTTIDTPIHQFSSFQLPAIPDLFRFHVYTTVEPVPHDRREGVYYWYLSVHPR